MPTIRSVAFLFLLGSVHLSLAQKVHFASNRQKNTTKIIEKSEAMEHIVSQSNIRKALPLFGEVPSNSYQKVEEVAFFKMCDKTFQNREEACSFFCERAWEYVAENELDTAIYRFNLAWSLDKLQPEPYWGFGVVAFHRQNYVEATRLLGKAIDVAPNNVSLLVDLATVHLALYEQRQKAEELTKATALLEKSISIDSHYSLAFLRLAKTAYFQEDYNKAWLYIHLSRGLDENALDLPLISDLMTKIPDPQGIYR